MIYIYIHIYHDGGSSSSVPRQEPQTDGRPDRDAVEKSLIHVRSPEVAGYRIYTREGFRV